MSDYPPTAWLSFPPPNPNGNHNVSNRNSAEIPPQSALAETREQSAQQQQQHQNDVAGVLRRNQACLACRRRKLKCDAVRPHCSTCIRSHKHLMRTAPRTNPVLSCDYDDGAGSHPNEQRTGHPVSPEEEEAEVARKKRKSAAGEGSRRKKESEEEKLRKRIEELEARLSVNDGGDVQEQVRAAQSRHSSLSNQTPPVPRSVNPNEPMTTAESPTPFLDILSAAATEQAPGSAHRNGSGGLRAGASGSAMMNGATGTSFPNLSRSTEMPQQPYTTGLTPSFTFDDLQQTGGLDHRPQIVEHDSAGSGVSMHSQPPPMGSASISPFGPSLSTASDPIPLTPSGVFNFSPGPPEPVNYNFESAPPPDKNGYIQPSTRLEGPWRGVETIDSFVSAAQARATGKLGIVPPDQQNFMPIDPMTDPSKYVPPMPGMNYGQTAPVQTAPAQTFVPPMEEDIQQQLLMELFWPGWPAGLPEPHIVHDLVDAFFDLVPSLPRMMLRSRFQTRLTLPPTHSNFPHPALLHAICAISASWCVPAVYERSTIARTLNGKVGNMSFSTWQAGLAKEAVHEGLNTGNRMFDVVRSMMILSRLFIDDTRMLECWAYHGLVARMILPLGLNVRSAELSLKSVMLPPPVDAVEREERRGAMWFAFYHDTVSSAASGWGGSINLDELTIPLPVSFKDFDSGAKEMTPNPQDIESPDLFTHHPVVDPFVLCLKASILLNRVTKFARKWKNRHLREDDDFEGMNKPDFRELANNIACFQMSFPYELRNPCKVDNKRHLDIDLIVAHLIPHTALICLYEPFADVTDSTDAPSRRIMAAAQATVGIVQQIAAVASEGNTNFSSVMHSAASVCLVTAARTSLLFYRQALNVKDDVLATSLRTDVEMIRMALEQFGLRFKIGHHHAQLVAYFLDRATYPTYDKLIAHYPDHPRQGAPALLPDSDFGLCVMSALNIKRGYWRIKRIHSAGPSPFGMTPDSARGSSGGMGGAKIDTESPQTRSGSISGGAGQPGSGSRVPTVNDLPVGGSKGNGSNGVPDETDLGFLFPHLGSNSSSSSSPQTNLGINTNTSSSTTNTNSQPFDPFAKMVNKFAVRPNGERAIFGVVDKDTPAGMGPVSYTTVFPTHAAQQEQKKQNNEEVGNVAETAAWFMAPEPGGLYRGARG